MEEGRGDLSRLARGGKRIRKLVGKAPRDALVAWRKATGVKNGSNPDDGGGTTDGATDTPGISIQEWISRYLEAVKATKGDETHSSYESCLKCAKRYITKHLVYWLDRNDLLTFLDAARYCTLGSKTGWIGLCDRDDSPLAFPLRHLPKWKSECARLIAIDQTLYHLAPKESAVQFPRHFIA